MSNENTEDRTGWYEFIMPGGSTTHIAYAHENGAVYLPEGEDVISTQDFHLASASNRFWRLIREPKKVTTVEELDALPDGSVILYHGRAFQRFAAQPSTFDEYRKWQCPDGGFVRSTKDGSSILPATILHSPAASK